MVICSDFTSLLELMNTGKFFKQCKTIVFEQNYSLLNLCYLAKKLEKL